MATFNCPSAAILSECFWDNCSVDRSTWLRQTDHRPFPCPNHILRTLLPPPTAQNYSLRNTPHNRPDRISRITDSNYTVRMMLHRNMYRLLYILGVCFVLFLCTTAVWQFAINEYVMLCYGQKVTADKWLNRNAHISWAGVFSRAACVRGCASVRGAERRAAAGSARGHSAAARWTFAPVANTRTTGNYIYYKHNYTYWEKFHLVEINVLMYQYKFRRNNQKVIYFCNHVTSWSAASVTDRESDWSTRWIKEAVHIRKEGPRSMNRDEGSYQLSHTYDCFLGSTLTCRAKNQKKKT